jgi:type I restriction enzyme M protein
MLDAQLKSNIKKLWDRFWSSGIANPIHAIEQMSYLIFMKRLEDEDTKKMKEAEFAGEKYKSIFEGQEECKWSIWTKKNPDEILNFVRYTVFPFMAGLGGKDSLYAHYMEDANFGIPTSSLLIEAINIINDMHIKEQNQDTQGDIYEYLLSELQTSGKNGQFRTPRHIIQMMVKMANPKFGDRVLDPACGTAGFLVNAYQHILEQNKKEGISTLDANKKRILDEESIFGFDIDSTMTRIALMNLMMHGIKRPNIERLNALSRAGNDKVPDEMYQVILANPPFKGSLNQSEISDRFRIKSKKTELLFLELMVQSLSSGGRCAVIVPDGVLFGNSKAHKDVRKMILENCRLDAIIKMPSGIFKPYAGVSTAILFFTKGEKTKKVWFYDMESDGFTLDDKRTQIGDGKGDIPDILERFKNRFEEKNEDRTKKHFFVPLEEIKEKDFDLSISKYKEIIYEEEVYRDPKEIKKDLLKTEEEIINGLKKLKI